MSSPTGKHRAIEALRHAFSGTRAINLLAIPSVVADAEKVVIGSETYEFDTNGVITAGNIKVDISAGGAKATGTVTSNNTNVSANDTVTANGQAYKFVTALTGAANEVFIGASADASLTNLASAINGTAGAGSTYGTGTVANAAVTSSAAPVSHVITLTAIITGTPGNSITLAKSAATLTVSGSTLSAGTNPTGAQSVTALVAAINGKTTQKIAASAPTTTEVLINSVACGTYTTVCTTTMGGSGNAWSAGAMYGGKGQSFPANWAASRSPNAQEVTDGNMYFAFAFQPAFARVSIRTSAGVMKSWDGVLSILTNRVVKLDNSGSTDWAATDTVICEAHE